MAGCWEILATAVSWVLLLLLLLVPTKAGRQQQCLPVAEQGQHGRADLQERRTPGEGAAPLRRAVGCCLAVAATACRRAHVCASLLPHTPHAGVSPTLLSVRLGFKFGLVALNVCPCIAEQTRLSCICAPCSCASSANAVRAPERCGRR